MVFVSQCASRVLRRPDGSIPASYLPPPPRSKLPMILLSKDPHFACLFNLLHQLSSFCPSSVSAVCILSFLYTYIYTGWPKKASRTLRNYNGTYTLWGEISFGTFVDQYVLLLLINFSDVINNDTVCRIMT